MASEYIKKIRTNSGDKQIDYEALANLPTINNKLLVGNLTLQDIGIDQISITTDEAMSDESTNPVQNKVIKEYIDSQIELAINASY